MKLPTTIFAYWDTETDDEPFLMANKEWAGLAEAGKPRLVGEYKLVDQREVALMAVWKAPMKKKAKDDPIIAQPRPVRKDEGL